MGSLSHDARILQEHLEIRRNCVIAGYGITPKEMVITVRRRGTSCLGKTGMSPSWRFPELREPLLVRTAGSAHSCSSSSASGVCLPLLFCGHVVAEGEVCIAATVCSVARVSSSGIHLHHRFYEPICEIPSPRNPMDSGFLVCSSEMP